MNYFANPAAAERYAKSRPYFHPLVVDRIKERRGSYGRFMRALDVGCGTGQSAVAVAQIADEVIGVDVSRAMLAQAPAHARITYVAAPAERLPFDDGGFDLMTAGLAFHWFKRDAALREAQRLLCPGGWLVIYNDGFTGQMIGHEGYAAWNEEYRARYPTPPRNSAPLTDTAMEAFDFTRIVRDSFTHDIAFSAEQLTGYLMTQSNVIAAVELGNESFQSVGDWLITSVRPFFGEEARNFRFFCEINIFMRSLAAS